MDPLEVQLNPLWRTLIMGHITSHGRDIPYRLYLIIVLSGVLFIQTGLALPQVAAHEVEHGHHQSGTHSSPLCAWFCAAGQAIDTFPQHDAAYFRAEEAIDSNPPSPRRTPPPSQPFARGPPSKV